MAHSDAGAGRRKRRPSNRALRQAVLRAGLLVFPGFIAAAWPAAAQQATWQLNPGSGDFNTATNWTPNTVPSNAVFDASNVTDLSFSAAATNSSRWEFVSGASNYTFTVPNGRSLSFSGAGIGVTGGSATIINAGSLAFLGSSSAGSAIITNNGSLDFDSRSTAGNANITNNGLLRFIENGTAGSANITNNGFLAFDFRGTGGNARLFNAPGATIQLTGPATAGMTAGSIEGFGTIRLGSRTLEVGGNNLSTTFAGVIQGNGSLIKRGTGDLTLNGQNTYTGATLVARGTLTVNGSIPGTVIVEPGAALEGSGRVGSVNTNGLLNPGNSIGTLSVDNNITFGTSSAYVVEFSSASDRINVNQTAALAGTVVLDFLPGAPFVRQYNILHAGLGFGGTTFDNVIAPPNFDVTLTYGSTDVLLDVTPSLGLGSTLSGNAFTVANAINNFYLGNGTLPVDFANLYDLTGAGLGNALAQVSGEIATGAATAGFQATGQFLNVMLDPFLENRAGGNGAAGVGGPALAFAPEDESALAYAKGLPRKAPPLAVPTFERRWTMWGAGYGGHGRFDGDPVIGSNDLRASTAGIAGGVDYRFGNSVIGAAVTGQSLSYRLDGLLGSGDGDAVQGGVYGSTKWGNAYVSAAVSFGWFDLETTRSVLLPGVTNVLTGDVSADSFGGRIEGGYRFPVLQSSGVTPYAALQAIRFHTDAYTEVGAAGGNAFALTYAANTTNDVRSELGLRVDTRMAVSDASMLILRGRAAWAHSFDDDRLINPFFVNLPGAGFTVFGATPAENSALVSAGGELRLANGFSLLAKFDGEFGGDTTVYAGSGTLRYSW
jgi:autotransporter-associated beta strand protein